MSTDDHIEMRACVLREPGAIATETVRLGAPRTGEVRVQLAAAGVCHSDMHLAEGKLGGGRCPIVLGHEGAGIVDAVGEGVKHVAAGDHVVLAMVGPCGQCDACRRGNRTLCEPAGSRSLAGAMVDGTSRLTG
ncbi:MAG: alcohol dehydrogenase catalytic domain-containing protein [Solirubrobacteraceae bacterium]